MIMSLKSVFVCSFFRREDNKWSYTEKEPEHSFQRPGRASNKQWQNKTAQLIVSTYRQKRIVIEESHWNGQQKTNTVWRDSTVFCFFFVFVFFFFLFFFLFFFFVFLFFVFYCCCFFFLFFTSCRRLLKGLFHCGSALWAAYIGVVLSHIKYDIHTKPSLGGSNYEDRWHLITNRTE